MYSSLAPRDILLACKKAWNTNCINVGQIHYWKKLKVTMNFTLKRRVQLPSTPSINIKSWLWTLKPWSNKSFIIRCINLRALHSKMLLWCLHLCEAKRALIVHIMRKWYIYHIHMCIQYIPQQPHKELSDALGNTIDKHDWLHRYLQQASSVKYHGWIITCWKTKEILSLLTKHSHF